MKERTRFESELEILKGSENFAGYSSGNYFGENMNYFYPQGEFEEETGSAYYSFDEEPVPLREHSVEWKIAHSRAAPENDVQTDLVKHLALPVLKNETKKQAQRVTDLQILFANTDLQTAKRLYRRLTDSKDFLGKLFHLTLHRDTRKYLLSILDSVIIVRSQTQPTPVIPPKPPISGVPPVVIPPKIVKPKPPIAGVPPPKKPTPPKQPQPPQKDPKIVAPRVPFPWRPPSYKMPAPSKNDWIESSLQSAAGFLGLTISIGLRALSKVSLEDAIEAAWIVFQVEQGGIKALYGLAGEAAAEAILKHTLGIDPSRIVNLNTIAANFPVLDITSPRGLISVKVKGVAGKLTGKALEEAINSAYVNDFFNMLIGDHPRAKRKLDKAAKFLLNNLQTLDRVRALPDDLKDFTEAGIKKYIQEKGLLQIPHDHVTMVRRGLGKKLAARIKNNKKLSDSLGIKNDLQLATFVNSQIDRITSLGVKSSDLIILAEAAATHLPPAQVGRLKKDFKKLRSKVYGTK